MPTANHLRASPDNQMSEGVQMPRTTALPLQPVAPETGDTKGKTYARNVSLHLTQVKSYRLLNTRAQEQYLRNNLRPKH
jgi:hypothetical protein